MIFADKSMIPIDQTKNIVVLRAKKRQCEGGFLPIISGKRKKSGKKLLLRRVPFAEANSGQIGK